MRILSLLRAAGYVKIQLGEPPLGGSLIRSESMNDFFLRWMEDR